MDLNADHDLVFELQLFAISLRILSTTSLVAFHLLVHIRIVWSGPTPSAALAQEFVLTIDSVKHQETQGTGQFCWNLPDCVLNGSPKINYVAAYQFDGEMRGSI